MSDEQGAGDADARDDAGDPDAPDPTDRTMARMELAAEVEELSPGLLAGIAAATERSGVFLGWLSPATPPAGVELAGWDDTGTGTGTDTGTDTEPSPEAVALPWRAAASPYVVLRPTEAPDAWIRGRRGVTPGSYSAEAALLIRELAPAPDPEGATGPATGPELRDVVRRWALLTADDALVQLCDDPAGHRRPRDWVLRADTAYQLEHDVEGGWRVHALS